MSIGNAVTVEGAAVFLHRHVLFDPQNCYREQYEGGDGEERSTHRRSHPARASSAACEASACAMILANSARALRVDSFTWLSSCFVAWRDDIPTIGYCQPKGGYLIMIGYDRSAKQNGETLSSLAAVLGE